MREKQLRHCGRRKRGRLHKKEERYPRRPPVAGEAATSLSSLRSKDKLGGGGYKSEKGDEGKPTTIIPWKSLH